MQCHAKLAIRKSVNSSDSDLERQTELWHMRVKLVGVLRLSRRWWFTSRSSELWRRVLWW